MTVDRRYTCAVVEREDGGYEWRATFQGELIGSGRSRFFWLAEVRAESACRKHGLEAQIAAVRRERG